MFGYKLWSLIIVTVCTLNALAQVTVTLPDTTADQGDQLCIPIEVGDVTGQDIVAFEFTVTFNPTLINTVAPYYDVTGGLAAGWTVLETHNNTTGVVNIGGFGTTALSGEGQLLGLQFQVLPEAPDGSISPLIFTSFVFNEGTPAAETINGSLTVGSSPEQILVAFPDTSAAAGAQLCIPVEVGDVTGQDIVSFEFTVTFNPTLVNSVAPYYDLTGGLAAGWSVMETHNNTTGTLNIGGFGTTPLADEGQLLCLQFQVLPEAPGGSVSPLTFTSFIFNEGTPVAETLNGSITVEGSDTDEEKSGFSIPANLYLAHNYPNPFNPTTTIEFGIPKTSHVHIGIYDILGRQVDIVVDGMIRAGVHQLVWDCRHCTSGVYLIVMSGEGINIVRKATLIR